MKTKILAICGEAGTCKDTILHELLKARPDFKEIISCTTRPPREKETDGLNYHFLTEEQFVQKINEQKMLEYAKFNNWYYGTSFDELNKDNINIGVFNPSGIYQLRDNPNVDLKVIRVVSSDKTRLLRQLVREEKPNVSEIIRRYQTDTDDFAIFNINLTEEDFSYSNEELNDLWNSSKAILDFCGSWAKAVNQ